MKIPNLPKGLLLIIFVLFSISSKTFAQTANNDSIKNELATILDSLDKKTKSLPSELILRFDYYGKTLSYGRDYGVKQYSLMPSLTYYHKSGVYGGVTGNWYSKDDPNYTMTDVVLGYTGVFNKKETWSYSASYDHYFFSPDSGRVLKNAFSAYTNYDFGPVNAGINYSYLFSKDESANSMQLSIAGFMVKRNIGFISKITFSPTISANFGTRNLPLSKLTFKQFYNVYGREWQDYKKENPNTPIKTYLGYVRKFHNDFYNQIKEQRSATKNQFGLMSWNFSFPLRVKIGKVGFGVTYFYVIPVKLPDEIYVDLHNQSYFSANINYTIGKK